MKKIYLPLIAIMAVGSMNAQDLMKSAQQTVGFQKYGVKPVAATATPSMRNSDAALNEAFELTVPPSGWSGSLWLASTAAQETKAVGHVGHFAYFDAYNEAAGNQGMLMTPILQPTAGNNILSYSVNYYNMSTNPGYQGAGAELYIEFSTDNGATWTTSTTNILATMGNYNTSTSTGWATQTASLAPYNGMNVVVRFRSVSDYGWSNIGLDNVTGPNIFALTNDISASAGVATNINGFDYFEVTPNSQLASVDFAVIANNNGSAAQTNVTLHADINSGAFMSATGMNNPITSLAGGSFDTLHASVTPSGTGFTAFSTGLALTQNEADQLPSNNMADSVVFFGSDYSFYRTVEIGGILSSYSFGASAPGVTGMEYGATYIMPNLGRVDSLTTLIYKNSGSGNIVGKLYTIDPITGAFLNVASTAAFTPPVGINSSLSLKTLAFTTPFVVPAGTLLAATVQMNIATGDTIYVGSDNAFPGNPAVAGLVWVKPAAGAFQWSSITGNVPIVGLELQNSSVGIANHAAADMISIYPNPSNGVFTLNIGENAKSTVEVFNVVGAKVKAVQFNAQSSTLDLTGVEAGVYFVKVTTEKGLVTKQITITK